MYCEDGREGKVLCFAELHTPEQGDWENDQENVGHDVGYRHGEEVCCAPLAGRRVVVVDMPESVHHISGSRPSREYAPTKRVAGTRA